MSTVLDVIAGLLIVIGLTASTLALVGTVRLPTTRTRVHAAGKTAGLGASLILLASIHTLELDIIVRSLVTAALLVLSAPVSSHVIGAAARDDREEKPGAR